MLASTSTDKSKKSSSFDETVSQFKHLVSLVNVPWNSSWIHVVVDDVDDDKGEVDDADVGDNNDNDGDVVVVVVVVDKDDDGEYGIDDDEESDGIVSAAEVAPDFFKLLLLFLGAVCGR